MAGTPDGPCGPRRAAGIPALERGYSSHGGWSTLGEIRQVEVEERGNEFPDLPACPEDTPAIWVAATPRKALRYWASASEWDRIDSGGKLSKEERDELRSIERSAIPILPTDRVVFDDGDDGYLVLRPGSAPTEGHIVPGAQSPGMGAPTGPGADHVQEAIRHLHLAIESGECGVCRDLYREEIATLEGIEQLRVNAEEIARAQAAKHEQLADGAEPEIRSYVEERVHTGPEGTHREFVRGAETAPRPVAGGPVEVARDWMRDRPRLLDALSFPRSRSP